MLYRIHNARYTRKKQHTYICKITYEIISNVMYLVLKLDIFYIFISFVKVGTIM